MQRRLLNSPSQNGTVSLPLHLGTRFNVPELPKMLPNSLSLPLACFTAWVGATLTIPKDSVTFRLYFRPPFPALRLMFFSATLLRCFRWNLGSHFLLGVPHTSNTPLMFLACGTNPCGNSRMHMTFRYMRTTLILLSCKWATPISWMLL